MGGPQFHSASRGACGYELGKQGSAEINPINLLLRSAARNAAVNGSTSCWKDSEDN